MAKLSVEIIGNAVGLSSAFAKAAADAEGFSGKMAAVGTRLTALGTTMTTHLTLPIAAIGAVSGKMAIDFQNAMELLHTQAHVGQDAVDKMSQSVLKLAGPTATAPDQLAAGLYHLASQGLRGADAMNALKAAAEGAKLGQANLEDVTNALGGVLVSGIHGIKSYGQAMGVLNGIVGSGDMRMQDLADAMGTGLPAAAATAHVSITQIGGALATFGDNNIRGAKAGTLLISTLRVLGHQSTAGAKALADLGVSSDTLQAKLASGGLTSAISYLNDRIKESGKSSAQTSSDLTEAFGGKQSTGIKILIDELARLKTKVTDVGQSGSTFASDWKSYTETTAYHLASMGAQMQATGVTIGTVLLPVVAKLADWIGTLASKFDSLSPRTQHIIEIAAGVAAALGPVVAIVGTLATAIGGLAAAFTFLAANPIVLAVAGIVALGAAIAAAVLWPDKLKGALEAMGLSAQHAGEVVSTLRTVFDDLKAVVEAVWPSIKNTIQSNIEVIKGIIEVFSGLLRGDWGKVWNGLKEVVDGVWKGIVGTVKGAVGLLGSAWDALKGDAIRAALAIVEPFSHLPSFLGGWARKAKDALLSEMVSMQNQAAIRANQIGAAIDRGMAGGVMGSTGVVASAVQSVIDVAIAAGKHKAKIKSPSQLFADEIGAPISEGIAQGIMDSAAGITAALTAAITGSTNAVMPLATSAGAAIAGAIAAGVQGALSYFMNNLYLSIANWLLSVTQKLGGLGVGIPPLPGNLITPPTSGTPGGGGGAPPPTIPQLAAGGIVTRPTLAMVGERGPEAVIPLNRGGLGNVTFNFPAYVGDKQELMNMVQQQLLRTQLRGGKLFLSGATT